MDILTFVSNIVTALAWPATFFSVVFLFRKQIMQLIKNMRSFRYKDTEIDLSKDLEELSMRNSNQKEHPVVINDKQMRLLDVSPRGAILEAWIDFESAVKSAAAKEGYAVENKNALRGRIGDVDSFTLISYLRLADRLTEANYNRYLKLRSIRNKAVHATDFEISQQNAETFIRLLSELKFDLEN